MSESKSHIDLVTVTATYIKNMVPENLANLIQCDAFYSKAPTTAIKNFIPDVYYWHNETLIIGEAKTLNDYDRQHSLDQYTAYLYECKKFYGKASIVLSVPWQVIPSARNIFRQLRKDLKCEEVTIHIINELGKGGTI